MCSCVLYEQLPGYTRLRVLFSRALWPLLITYHYSVIIYQHMSDQLFQWHRNTRNDYSIFSEVTLIKVLYPHFHIIQMIYLWRQTCLVPSSGGDEVRAASA